VRGLNSTPVIVELLEVVHQLLVLRAIQVHGSWRNQAEIEIGLFSRQCLGKRRIPALKMLRREAHAWNRRMNRNRIKINWKFTRKAARSKFGYKRKSFNRS
jgi:hypothetical protein